MSGINLRGYVSTALESRTGDIRTAKGSQDQALVNKGTFGNKVASFFQAIGEKLNLVRPDPTRAARQQAAVDQFKEALTGFYGQAVADRAIQQANLTTASRLSGAQVLTAIDSAKAEVGRFRTANLAAMQDFLPADRGRPPGAKLVTLAGSLRPPVDAGHMPVEQRQAFTERLNEGMAALSMSGRKQVSEGEMADLAKAALKTTVRIANNPGLSLAAAREAKDAYVASLKDVLRAVATNAGPGPLLDRLMNAQARFETHARAEGMTELGGDDREAMMEVGFLGAFRELNAENPRLATQAQAAALKEGSSFAQVYSGTERVVSGASYDEDEMTGAAFVQKTMVSLLGGLARQLSSETGDDMNRLLDVGERVPATTSDSVAKLLCEKLRQGV